MEHNLSTAFQFHQRGELDQAARIYQRLLAGNPENADVLHLLGVVSIQQGDPSRAIELISRAVARSPGVAAYHANLAEAYRMVGQYEAAANCCRTALRLQPHFPGAANNLGLSLQGLGQTQAAIDQYREALRLQPDFAMAHNNLGIALRSQGDQAQAIAHFRQALRFAPTLAEAHSNLGQMLYAQNALNEALDHCREAVRLRPNFVEALINTGIVLRGLGRPAEAKAYYAEALRLNPDLAVACNNMGQIVQEEGNLEESLSWYQRSLQLESNSVLVHCNLASVLKEQGRLNEAIAHYDMALRLDPASADAHNGRGWVRHEQGYCEEAEGHYRESLRLRGSFALAHCNLGTVLEEQGDFAAAERCFRQALEHDPKHVDAHTLLASLLGGKLPEANVAAIRDLIAEPTLPDSKRLALHFSLAQVYDARRHYDAAAEHLRRGNALCLAEWHKQGRSYDRAHHERSVEVLIATFTPAYFERVRGFGLDTDRPVFIVGLPRSGTTLTEQILASHSQVFGAGELALVRETYEAIPRAMNHDATPVECFGRLDRPTAERVAWHHLEQLGALDPTSPRIVDKMPENYLYLGMLATLFPRATFLHCRRDLRDVAVSCWMTYFRHIRWSSDPEHIASRIQTYEHVMDHWRRVLPIRWLDVQYEETVDDLEAVARRLVAWCGLDWEPACLAFHQGRRTVRSASVTQVRQPLYTHAVARWKNYEQALAPLLSRLERP